MDGDGRLEHRAELSEIFEREFAKEDVDYWIKAIKKVGLPAAPVNTVDKALSDEQVLARHMVFEQDHPGVGKYKAIGNPVKSSYADDGPYAPAPQLGQHSEEILSGWADYSPERIESLRKAGVI